MNKFTIGPMVLGPGMIMLAVSLVLLLAGLILLIKLLRTDWNMSVGAFNTKFMYETSLGQEDIRQNTKRREMAARLGIRHELKPEEKVLEHEDKTEDFSKREDDDFKTEELR